MYIIAIAWLYVAVLAAVSSTTVAGGVLTFLLAGVGPLALFLWIVGTPARRRAAAQRDATDSADTNDRTECARKQ